MSQSQPSGKFFNKFKTKSNDIVDKIEHFPYLPTARTTLMISVSLLVAMSLLMIASAGAPFAISKGGHALDFFVRQLMFVLAGLLAGAAVYKVDIKRLTSISTIVLAWGFCVALLVVTVLIAPEVNGAKRWISLGVVNFQPAELCKMVMAMAVAEYAVRRSADVREKFISNLRLVVPVGVIGLLLSFQPDFGSFVVIVATMMVVLFIAGVQIKHYCILAVGAAIPLAAFALSDEYRLRRLMSFFDPFADYEDGGYQVSNSLMALARGGVFGQGYGDSVKKLAHLPEAHTDFLLAITGEELGLVGVLTVLALEFLTIASMMAISYMTFKRRQLILSYTTFSFAIIFFGQTVINAGMNLGIVPAKGLTLPFFSYGGSSIVVCFMMLGYVLNVYKSSPIIAANRESASY